MRCYVKQIEEVFCKADKRGGYVKQIEEVVPCLCA